MDWRARIIVAILFLLAAAGVVYGVPRALAPDAEPVAPIDVTPPPERPGERKAPRGRGARSERRARPPAPSQQPPARQPPARQPPSQRPPAQQPPPAKRSPSQQRPPAQRPLPPVAPAPAPAPAPPSPGDDGDDDDGDDDGRGDD